MSISSINFKAAQNNSESHNLRTSVLDYVIPELTPNNSSWSIATIDEKRKEISSLCKKLSGRKLQKNSEPIREACVNLGPKTTIEDLKRLGEALKQNFGMECFQIHIHKDEGHKDKTTGEWKENLHAHMLFDWQDKEKGTMLRFKKLDMSKIQTLVAEILKLERGELKTNSNRERLEAVEYKTEQETLKLQELQKQNADLEQKKNEARARIERLAEERGVNPDNTENETSRNKALRELIFSSTDIFQENISKLSSYDENDLNRAIKELECDIERVKNNYGTEKKNS